jgi:NADH-quinone oxidoreductase subunit I
MSPLYGKGILESLKIVFRHFIQTYTVDLRDLFGRKTDVEKNKFRSSSKSKGLFTIEYPEKPRQLPEEFRVIPFLVYDELDDGSQKLRCTACGTCARVCPTQCIWIVRGKDPETGRPKPVPTAFWIDGNTCMNCGSCAEFCPFDAIRMDHDFELASEHRTDFFFDMAKLGKPAAYYQKIRPEQFERERASREKKVEGAG